MAKCTAPIYGHRTESGRANCPVCGVSFASYPRYPHIFSPNNALSNFVSSRVTKGEKFAKVNAGLQAILPLHIQTQKYELLLPYAKMWKSVRKFKI